MNTILPPPPPFIYNDLISKCKKLKENVSPFYYPGDPQKDFYEDLLDHIELYFPYFENIILELYTLIEELRSFSIIHERHFIIPDNMIKMQCKKEDILRKQYILNNKLTVKRINDISTLANVCAKSVRHYFNKFKILKVERRKKIMSLPTPKITQREIVEYYINNSREQMVDIAKKFKMRTGTANSLIYKLRQRGYDIPKRRKNNGAYELLSRKKKPISSLAPLKEKVINIDTTLQNIVVSNYIVLTPSPSSSNDMMFS